MPETPVPGERPVTPVPGESPVTPVPGESPVAPVPGERPVTYVIGFKVRPGQRERFLALLEPVLDAMRHEPTFRSATLNADPEDDHRFLLHESWDSHTEVLAVQIHRPYRAAFHAALEDLLAAPREIGIWTELRSDHRA